MYYTDPWGKGMGFEDVFTKIDMCRKHFEAVGLAPATPTSSSADPVRLAPWRRTPAAALQAPPARRPAMRPDPCRASPQHKTKEQGRQDE